LVAALCLVSAGVVRAAETAAAPAPAAEETVYIQEYRVMGSKQLPPVEVEAAVYPYLGPGRTTRDVEMARAALEKSYQEKGYQTVMVQIPPQQVRGGVVVLQVVEASVGRLTVTGARYFSPELIKKGVPSLQVGSVPNFNQVSREIVALNQWPDRRVTPSLKAGAVPGTVDVELTVNDTLPLHGSLELNNRYSANTTPLRLNGSISYNNLWQLGHSAGFSFQLAPERLEDAEVFSGYYVVRFPEISWLSLMVQGTRQNSNVSTLGGGAVAGNGEIAGFRLMATLPSRKGFYHSLSFGMDYKHFEQNLMLGGQFIGTPITYYPFSLVYAAAWAGEGYSTDLSSGLVFAFPAVGSDEFEFDNRRYNATGAFALFRGSLSHTRDLPLGFQLFAEIQGQLAGSPLVDSEQFSGGGLDTVRGYLESEVLGDNAAIASVELRTPTPPAGTWGIDEWRAYGFVDGGVLTLLDPLPEQQRQFNLASVGLGSRLRIFRHFNGSLDAGFPLISQNPTAAGSVLMTFRLWGDF
jgi:hemolysin activation/secretion protein